jgi:lipopolysaccharide exporter
MVGSVAWVVGWRFATRLLGVASAFVLVRLLAPTDFGLIMLATAFTSAVEALSAVGIQDAVIREKTADRTLYDTAFTMNAVRCVAIGMLVSAAAWPAAAFFAEPKLVEVLLALALLTAVGAGENIRVVDFRRDFAFHQEFQLLLFPRLASIAASIAVAAIWHSYWALVVGLATNRLLQLALGYALRPYLPRPCLSDWRRIIGFSVWTWLSSLVLLVRDRSHTIIIGRSLGTLQVGLFSVGAELAALPSTEMVEPLCRVLFPSFVATRHTGGSLAEVYFQALMVTSLVTMPACIGIAMVASPLVALVFGPDWSGAVPVVVTLAIAGTVNVIAYISGTLFTATGLLTSTFRIVVVTAAVRVALLVTLVPRFGLIGGAVAILVTVVLEELMFLAISAHKLGFPILEMPRRLWRNVTATGIMAATLSLSGLGWSTSPALPDHPAQRLLVAVPLGIAVYVAALAAAWLLAGRPEGAELHLLRVMARLAGRLLKILRRWRRVTQEF